MSAVTDTLARCAVGLTCKAFVSLGLCSLTVEGLPTLLRALESPRRKQGQGIITVSNHISTLDDPLTWAVLPPRSYIRSHTTRWTLGASDIMFTNPVFSAFFRSGQVLETFRGHGVFQRSVDVAIEKLDDGAWVHLFPEGKVNQTLDMYEGTPHLSRFKWGIGRIIMETASPPIIIPMWLSGFDTLMPELRSAPYKYIPRPFQSLRVTFGEPIPEDVFRAGLVDCAKRVKSAAEPNPQSDASARKTGPDVSVKERDERETGKMAPWIREKLFPYGVLESDGGEGERKDDSDRQHRHRRHPAGGLDLVMMRSEITAFVQRRVEALGRRVLDR